MSGLDQKGTKFPNGVAVDAGKLFIGGTAMNSSATELDQYSLNGQFADADTAGSIYVVAPHAGKIVGLHAVNAVANTTTKTVLTAKLGGTSVTADAWEIAATQAAGTASSVVPTADNVVAVGDVIEIASDGGGATSSMVTGITIVIQRT